MLCLQWLIWLGEVGVISLPLSAEAIVVIEIQGEQICISLWSMPLSQVFQNMTTMTPRRRSQAPQPWSVAPCRALPHSEERVGFLVWFLSGESPGGLWQLCWVTSKDWRRKVFGSRLDWNTWVVAFLRKACPEMELPNFGWEVEKNPGWEKPFETRRMLLRKSPWGRANWALVSYKVGPKDPVISRVITPFVGVKKQNSYQLPGNSAGDLFGMVSENVTLFNSWLFVTSND